jgi:DNA-binding LacI/PurR family transcriptional regulator
VEDDRVPLAASLSVPSVLIGVPRDSSGLQCVDVDFEHAAELVVEELVATGHERILLLGHPAELINRHLNFTCRFTDSAIRALHRQRLPYEHISPVESGRVGARQVVARIMADFHREQRVGLIIPNSQTVQPILNALVAQGVVPGRDISVIAHCNDETAVETEPPVTNVTLEPREVSRRAITTVFRLLDRDQPRPDAIVDLVPPRLTRRDTIMPFPNAEPDGTPQRDLALLP